MTDFRVREPDEDDWTTVEAGDADEAAEVACERWHSHGRWAGDTMPSAIEVIVDNGGDVDRFSVAVDWSPNFCATRAR